MSKQTRKIIGFFNKDKKVQEEFSFYTSAKGNKGSLVVLDFDIKDNLFSESQMRWQDERSAKGIETGYKEGVLKIGETSLEFYQS